MKTRLSLFVVPVLLVHVVLAANAQSSFPVEARLVVPYTRILPGVPFEMWVEVENPSEYTVHLNVCGPLRVRVVDVNGRPDFNNEQQYSYTPKQAYEYQVRPPEPYAEALLAPGDNRPIALPIRMGLRGPKLEDDTVPPMTPGRTYAVALELCLVEQPRNMSFPPSMKFPPRFESALITNEVEVEVIAPTGDDGEVWQRLSASVGGNWSIAPRARAESRKVWEEVLEQFPLSSYFPYAVLATMPPPSQSTLSLIRDAISRFPDSPALELLYVQAWRTAQALRMTSLAESYREVVAGSKRPTTRAILCPPENGCVDRPPAEQ